MKDRVGPFLSFALLGLVAPARAQSVRATGPDHVSVRCEGVSLGQVLKELAALAPVDIVVTDPSFANRLVSASFDHVPLAEAAARVLQETGLNFAVGGLQGQPLRVIVGGTDLGRLASNAPRGVAKKEAPVREAGPRPLLASPPAGPDPDQLEREARAARGEPSPAASAHAELAPPFSVDSQATTESVYVPAAGSAPGFTMVGESVTFDDPTFVPYKNTEAAKRARQAVDVSKIP